MNFELKLHTLLTEAFDPWNYHKYILSNPHIDDIVSMLKLLRKNYDTNLIYNYLLDMFPKWREIVFPKLSKDDIIKITEIIRSFGLNDKQLINLGMSKFIEADPTKSGFVRKFNHETHLKNVMYNIMHGIDEWANLHPNIILDILEENFEFLEKLDTEFVEQFEEFLDKRINKYNQEKTFGDNLKDIINDLKKPPDNLGEV